MELAAERVARRIDAYGDTISSEAISQDAITASSLTVPPTALSALVSAAGDCRFRTDGTDPTITIGHPLNAGQNVEIFGTADLGNFAIISQSGTVDVFVTYFV